MKFSTPYAYRKGRDEKSFATINNEESLTQQSDAIDCDINVIMERYGQTGQVPQLLTPGIGGDFSIITDYRSALDAVRRADEQFHEIPAAIRNEFQNDAGKFIEFAQNPENIDKLREWKLAPKAPDPVPSPRATAEPQTYYGDEGESPRRNNSNVTARSHGYESNTNVSRGTEQPTSGSREPPRAGQPSVRHGEELRAPGPRESR